MNTVKCQDSVQKPRSITVLDATTRKRDFSDAFGLSATREAVVDWD